MANVTRFATAHWEGDLMSGKGALSTPQSGLFADQNYSFKTRFGDEKGTNPEELLAAAHAGCFTMALSLVLKNADLVADRIDTRAELKVDMAGAAPAIAHITLKVKAKVPGASEDAFRDAAENAKKNCVVSRALSVPVSLEAELEG